MTESLSGPPAEPQEPAIDPSPTQEPSEPAEPSTPSWPEIKRLREEAGKRRHQVRELQTENSQLRERVEASDRAEVERLVGDRLVDPADLWTSVELSSLRDDDGAVDTDKVNEAVASLVERKPHFAPAPTNFNGGVRRTVTQGTSFGAALKNRLSGR